MKVEALTHRDVRGKVLYYVKFVNKKGTELLINVGQATVETLTKMNKEDEESTTKDDAGQGKTVQPAAGTVGSAGRVR